MKGDRGLLGTRADSSEATRAGGLAVSSRRQALEMLRSAAGCGRPRPILLTGESGTGKTWLWRRFTRELPASWRWLSVEMTGAMEVSEFLELVGHELGITTGGRLSTARPAMARTLEDEAAEGRSWVLVIENAQRTPEPIWNELDSFLHSMEASTGFALIILVGTSDLTRMLKTRERRTMAGRIDTHVHLLPLDVEETRELAEVEWDADRPERTVLEELHQVAGGNPRGIIQLLRRGMAGYSAPVPRGGLKSPRPLPELPVQEPRTISPRGAERGGERPRDLPGPIPPPLVPSRPPIRVEEGLIEVGWEGSLESEQAADPEYGQQAGEPSVDARSEEGSIPSEESIEDHYAALQAWSEWARNRGHSASAPADGFDSDPAAAVSSSQETTEPVTTPEAETRLAPRLRAEAQHEHSPYSQLFTQLRQSR